jgi:non-canonical purine NTP pyrophosphatase (RdgB/HAM1 family)
MDIFFVTSNQGKLREAQELLAEIRGIDLDLTEIQELDATKIIRAKLAEAQKSHTGRFMVEDTSLYLDEMHGLPGPLIRWFLQSIGTEGIYRLSQTFGNARATARTWIGYANEHGEVAFFEGVIFGTVVMPRGTGGFGWDAIFQPNGSAKTFAEMTSQEKQQFSMRRIAIEQLQQHLHM